MTQTQIDHTREPFGTIFGRGVTVVADGGDGRANPEMRDLNQQFPAGDGPTVFDRGTEARDGSV